MSPAHKIKDISSIMLAPKVTSMVVLILVSSTNPPHSATLHSLFYRIQPQSTCSHSYTPTYQQDYQHFCSQLWPPIIFPPSVGSSSPQSPWTSNAGQNLEQLCSSKMQSLSDTISTREPSNLKLSPLARSDLLESPSFLNLMESKCSYLLYYCSEIFCTLVNPILATKS